MMKKLNNTWTKTSESIDAPLFTVLIPTYNRAILVRRAINSALSELSPAEREIIVVDDGSSDETQTALESLDGIIYHRSNANLGLARARNKGIELAKGKWIVFLDSDNYIIKGGLGKLRDLAVKFDDSIGILWAGNVDATGRQMVVHAETGVFSGDEIFRETFRGENFSVVRADLAKAHPFPAICRRHACEPIFWYTLASRTKLFVTNEVVGYYETMGDDRFCSLLVRLSRADELAICYAGVIDQVGCNILKVCPPVYWRLYAKLAFHRAVSGQWFGAIRAAWRGLGGIRHSPGNSWVLLLVIPGPWLSRLIMRIRG